jgi:hypothetical protein
MDKKKKFNKFIRAHSMNISDTEPDLGHLVVIRDSEIDELNNMLFDDEKQEK